LRKKHSVGNTNFGVSRVLTFHKIKRSIYYLPFAAFNFLERQFKQHNDTIVKMVRVSHVPFGITVELQWLISVADEIMLIQLKQLQKGTRIIQSICSDAKVQPMILCTALIP
jgi:hypothetical protein